MPLPRMLDRLWDTTTTTGTGTVTLGAEAAHIGFRRFIEGLSNTNIVYYVIVHRSLDEWEAGVGTYTTSGTTLARSKVLANQAGTATAVNFSAGTKDVYLIYTADQATQLQAAIRGICQGRLTLTTALPVTVADVTAAGTIYFAPYNGGSAIDLYDGVRSKVHNFAELSLAISLTTHVTPTGTTTSGNALITSMSSTTGLYPGQVITGTNLLPNTTIRSVDSGSQVTVSANSTGSGSGITFTIRHANYDVFVYDNAGVLTMEALAWTNNTTRATMLALQDGYLCKSGDLTKRYVGSFRSDGLNTTADSELRRFVFNACNRVPRVLRVVDTTNSWTYSAATYQQANASWVNKVEVFTGNTDSFLSLLVLAQFQNSTAGINGRVGIGRGSVIANAAQLMSGSSQEVAATGLVACQARLKEYAALGYQYYAWLEAGQASGTTTWRGDDGSTLIQNGMLGQIMA